MAKKKSDKETEPKKVSTKRFSAFLKNETTHFVIGLISVIFAVYLLLAFTSFFFTGAADQSILDNQQPGELMQTANHVKNYAGARGAQLAEFLINECFGLAAYFIILFLAVVGMKLMKAYQFRIWKWFMSCSILLIWFSITLGFIFDGTFGDSFIYPGGLHGHNVSNWLISQIGIPGLGLLLFIAALLFFIYLSNETILVIRKALRPSFRRKKKEDQTISATEENPIKEAPRKEESRKEFSNPGPAIVDFELEQPTKKEEEVEEQVPFPFESKQVTEPAVIEEPAYTNEEEEVENTDEPDFSISEETNEEDEAYKGPVLPPYNPRLDLENYKFPSLDLLNEYEDDGPNIDMEEQNANKDRIIKVLRSFGIEISSIKASVGPTITLYEITPAEGVRISKIRNLEDDIALSLSALGIRIIAPIPGKGTIGIEVPNANPRIVPMKSILNSIIGGVETMVNGIVNSLNKLIDGLNKVVSAAGKALGLAWKVPSLGKVSLPRLEKGGILEAGQMGFLEGNGAEAVVPLDRNSAWINAVAKDMEAAGIGGNSQQTQRIIDLLEMLIALLPDTLKDAFESMKFDINNREFARLVKAVN